MVGYWWWFQVVEVTDDDVKDTVLAKKCNAAPRIFLLGFFRGRRGPRRFQRSYRKTSQSIAPENGCKHQ